jgi:single-strand DNA-binding protein
MLNQAQIIGHVGRDPEVRNFPNGDPVASLSVATTEKWKDKANGEQREAVEWHRVRVTGKLAEIVKKWVIKGSLVYVSGKIVTRKYQDKDGTEKEITEIRADSLKLLGSNKGGQQEPSRQQAKPSQAHSSPGADLDDDIPF